jgi:hypothetical protein
MSSSTNQLKWLKYYHDDWLYDVAAIEAYHPPRGFDVEVSEAPFLTKHTEHQVVPPHLKLRLSRTPDPSQFVFLENAKGDRVSVFAEQIDGNNIVVTGLFDDNFVQAAFDQRPA